MPATERRRSRGLVRSGRIEREDRGEDEQVLRGCQAHHAGADVVALEESPLRPARIVDTVFAAGRRHRPPHSAPSRSTWSHETFSELLWKFGVSKNCQRPSINRCRPRPGPGFPTPTHSVPSGVAARASLHNHRRADAHSRPWRGSPACRLSSDSDSRGHSTRRCHRAPS
jgi:hypothetical protein